MAHVLIAEDEQTLAFFIKQILLELYPDIQVDWAPSGTSALRLLEKTSYDLLITDLRIPGLNGLALIENGHRLYPNLPVILMTGFASPNVEKQVAAMGINAYLAKPFTVESLANCINQLLAMKTPARLQVASHISRYK